MKLGNQTNRIGKHYTADFWYKRSLEAGDLCRDGAYIGVILITRVDCILKGHHPKLSILYVPDL